MFQARGAGGQRLGATAYLLYSGGKQGASVARVECEEEWAGDRSEAPEKPTDQQEGWGFTLKKEALEGV